MTILGQLCRFDTNFPNVHDYVILSKKFLREGSLHFLEVIPKLCLVYHIHVHYVVLLKYQIANNAWLSC